MAEAIVGSWRLFLGIWPQPEVRTALLEHARQWTWSEGARPTRPERLHLTLHFLGAVPVAQLPALREGLRLPWSGCALDLDLPQVWPGGTAVLEASVVPLALAQLHAGLATALRQLGLAVEERRYRPHVTLARKAQGTRPPAAAPLRWPLAPNYVLVRTLPGGGGYQPVQVFD
jgi:2'-5' RNA ligase